MGEPKRWEHTHTMTPMPSPISRGLVAVPVMIDPLEPTIAFREVDWREADNAHFEQHGAEWFVVDGTRPWTCVEVPNVG